MDTRDLVGYCNDMGYDTDDFFYERGTYSTHITYTPFQLTVTGLGKNETESGHLASALMLDALKLRASKPKNEMSIDKTKLKEYIDTLIGCGDEFEYETIDTFKDLKFRCTLSHPDFKFTIIRYDENRELAEDNAARAFHKFCEINTEFLGSHDLILGF